MSKKSQNTFSVILKPNGENLTQALHDTINWIKQQEQLHQDLTRETFHRCLIEALHDLELFKKARWQ